MTVNIFEKASRQKIRFQTKRGEVSVESLWDLPLQELDTIAMTAYNEVQGKEKRSFLTETTSENTKAHLQLELAKYVLLKRQDENQKRIKKQENAQEATLIQAILAQREVNKLEGASEEELQKRLKELSSD